MRRIQYQVKASTPFIPETITEDKWHFAWSEPVRQKIAPALAVALAASSGLFAPVLNPNTEIIQTFESRWHYAWSEPVRHKPQLHVSKQPFGAWAPRDAFSLSGLISWYAPLGEPVRLPTGLRAWLQQTVTWPPRLLPPTNVSGTLNAKEINTDIALFGLYVYSSSVTPYVQFAGANVTVSEIISNNAAASISEGS